MSLLEITGNPFVDTGLGVMLAISQKSLAIFGEDDLKDLVREYDLSLSNRRLKAFSMVFGTNSPLTNPSINPSMKKNSVGGYTSTDDPGFKKYSAFINLLVDATITGAEGPICDACGRPKVIEYGIDICREWFPLLGSIGNDAQIFPAATRAAKICPHCLLAVQFLPVGVLLIGGKLACFQSTHYDLTFSLIEQIVNENLSKLSTSKSSARIEIMGVKEGSRSAVSKLVETLDRVQRIGRIQKLPDHVSMNVFLFNNSGQKADCEIAEIPNKALAFMWEAIQLCGSELREIIQGDGGKHMLNSIWSEQDFYYLYPRKASKSSRDGSEQEKGLGAASRELFELYQTRVMGHKLDALQTAARIASYLVNSLSGGNKDSIKMLSQLIKESVLSQKSRTGYYFFRRFLAELAEDGKLSLEEYTTLFPQDIQNKHLTIQPDGYKWIWFYLNHDISQRLKTFIGGKALNTNPRIKTFARDLFEYYSNIRGIQYIKKNIIDGFKNNKITGNDMRNWFIMLAETKQGYTSESWDELCRNDDGDDQIGEVRFQLRLDIANLYRQHITNQVTQIGGK